MEENTELSEDEISQRIIALNINIADLLEKITELINDIENI